MLISRCRTYLLPSLLLTVEPLAAQEATAVPGHLADSTLIFLAPLIGRWLPVLPDNMLRQIGHQPVAGDFAWVVGRKAIRLREDYPLGGSPDSSRVEGLIYWNPATERVEFVFVGGPGSGEGRLFVGEYRRRADGVIEREYEVFYRTLADVPGEELGGLRRRYRETATFSAPDTIQTTLEWWSGGAWRPFGPFRRGTYVRARP